MKKIIILSCLVALLLPFSAHSESKAKTLVVSQREVINQSIVGQDFKKQLDKIAGDIDREIKSKSSLLLSKRDQLNKEIQGLKSQAEIGKRPDLQKRFQSLQQEMVKFEQDRAKKINEIRETEQKALKPVREQLEVIYDYLINLKGADVILDRDVVIRFNSKHGVDVTQDVVKQLNSRLKTVRVTRVRLPDAPAVSTQRP